MEIFHILRRGGFARAVPKPGKPLEFVSRAFFLQVLDCRLNDRDSSLPVSCSLSACFAMCLFGESSLSRVRHYRVIFRQQCYVFCRGGRRFFFQVGCFCSVRSHRDSAFISDAAFFGAAAGIALCVSCPKKVLYTEPFTFHLSPLPLKRQLHTRSDKGYGFCQRGSRFSSPLAA